MPVMAVVRAMTAERPLVSWGTLGQAAFSSGVGHT